MRPFRKPQRTRQKPWATRLLAIACALVVTSITAATVGSANAEEREDQAEPMQLVWADEFDGPAGTGPDPENWGFDVGGEGWGNYELQYHTDSLDNAAHDGEGNMVITARQDNPDNLECWYGTCEYTSARLLTQGNFDHQYGRFEANIQIPTGQGVWPAFWMLGANFDDIGWPYSGEIDIMENVGHEPGTVHGTIHGPGYSAGDGIGESYEHPDGGEFTDNFHVYAIDWGPGFITWSVDGNDYLTLTPDDLDGEEWVFDQPFFMIMNIAVGGEWPGDPDETTEFPQEMKIDYVRVYGG